MFFHWNQMALKPREYTAPASDTGMSACVPEAKLWAIITQRLKRRAPRKYWSVRPTRRPIQRPRTAMPMR